MAIEEANIGKMKRDKNTAGYEKSNKVSNGIFNLPLEEFATLQ